MRLDNESTFKAFSVKISSADTIYDLKKLIKAEKTPKFDDISADELTLWRVSVLISDDEEELPIKPNSLTYKKRLGPAARFSNVFPEGLLEGTAHIIVHRPPTRY
ncbi:hypothetical protein BG011_000423 [Mortierella polycephala]|uniref:Crinkler effector protein N-terminal domain-containing protein n=1 Tax=Mortierella polycephala TaxID=41804 RepID=A0A9P6PLA1_9FUNG|nr:hypothetical protein BG011_000423 [Mortierella polycephala]